MNQKTSSFCYEHWKNDDYNDQLWDRVFDVNSYRTNMYVQRPEETSLSRQCSKHNYKNDLAIVDQNNLRNYTLESRLKTLHLPNTRDLLSSVSLTAQCGKGVNTNLKPFAHPHSEDSCQKPVRNNVPDRSHQGPQELEFNRLSLRKPTSVIYDTCDQRVCFIPRD